MSLHLAEISARLTPGKHCALLVDQAGWHISERLAVPSNITIVALPAKCPELNPVENVWQMASYDWNTRLDSQLSRMNRRPLLLRLEPARRSTLARHVHRTARLGHGSHSVSLGISPMEFDRDKASA
jgi:transposase